jgi:hypothetical protein
MTTTRPHPDGVRRRLAVTGPRLELLAAILLGVATLCTAWAAYQSRQWTGEQSSATARATATRIAENRAAAVANRQVQIDVATFIQWLNAHQEHHPELAAFYRARFRAEFRPAFAAWIAARPFADTAAPPTPFAMSEYRLKATADAERLERAAATATGQAKAANERADNYMLAVVLCASSLFFAGLSTKLATQRARIAVLAMGAVVVLVALTWILTLPVQLTS